MLGCFDRCQGRRHVAIESATCKTHHDFELYTSPHINQDHNLDLRAPQLQAMSKTIKTRILIISDTHCAALESRDDSPPPLAPFKAPLPSADLLIHCGDLTMTGQMSEYHKTLDMLSAIEAPVKVVIAGNHDLSLDRDFVHSHRERDPQNRQPALSEAEAEARWKEARDLWTSPDGRAQQEGVTFLDEGVHLIDLLNGAKVRLYASPYTPEFYDWGFPYERDEDRFNPAKDSLADAKNITKHPIPEGTAAEAVDIVVTHGPPWQRLDPTVHGVSAGCPHLLRALMRSRPKLCCYGHIHEGWGAERLKWSDDVLGVLARQDSIDTWKGGGWRDGVADGGKAIETIESDFESAREKHAVFVDVSKEGGKPIGQGDETLMVNAAIMDVGYRPVNAPCVVDLDLPVAG